MNLVLFNYLNIVATNFANFKGRTRRSEYWLFAFTNAVIAVILAVISMIIGIKLNTLLLIYLLAILLPSYAVGVRRLHDTGKSAWWLLVAFIPFVGGLIFIGLMLVPGEERDNEYGPDPKASKIV